jgi:hypothetical protein
MKQQCFYVEYTDTFGGEANYSWVQRHEIVADPGISDRALARRAKKLCGISGWKGKAFWNGDSYEFRPYGSCTVMFITVYH